MKSGTCFVLLINPLETGLRTRPTLASTTERSPQCRGPARWATKSGQSLRVALPCRVASSPWTTSVVVRSGVLVPLRTRAVSRFLTTYLATSGHDAFPTRTETSSGSSVRLRAGPSTSGVGTQGRGAPQGQSSGSARRDYDRGRIQSRRPGPLAPEALQPPSRPRDGW